MNKLQEEIDSVCDAIEMSKMPFVIIPYMDKPLAVRIANHFRNAGFKCELTSEREIGFSEPIYFFVKIHLR